MKTHYIEPGNAFILCRTPGPGDKSDISPEMVDCELCLEILNTQTIHVTLNGITAYCGIPVDKHPYVTVEHVKSTTCRKCYEAYRSTLPVRVSDGVRCVYCWEPCEPRSGIATYSKGNRSVEIQVKYFQCSQSCEAPWGGPYRFTPRNYQAQYRVRAAEAWRNKYNEDMPW